MHLRNVDAGGGAFEMPLTITSRPVSPPTLNGANHPSSNRTVPLKPKSLPDSSPSPSPFDLLLAWLLVLYRDNDDAISRVNWGCRRDGHPSSPAAFERFLDLGSLPFQKTDALSDARRALTELYSSSDDVPAIVVGNEFYFDNGVKTVSAPSDPEKESQRSPPNNWTYQIQASLIEQQLDITAQWVRNSFSHQFANARLDVFVDILGQIIDHPDQQVSTAIGPTRADLDQLWSWNAVLPPTIDRCMHEFVTEQAASHPDSPAVESWDGSFTYRDVEELSTRLALHLVARGAQVGGIIPLCFEKSRWTVVAVLAVMKAGSAFALTDPSQPEARLRTIVQQTRPKILLTSHQQSDLGRRLAGDEAEVVVVVVSSHLLNVIAIASTSPGVGLPPIPTSSPLYIQFTSGSTGKPKGVVCSHANYTSGAVPRAHAVGYRPHSRVFDFASYAFDVSIDCMLCTLANGGCLCIPSDEDRINDLSGAIRNTKCNMAHMTPSVARVLDPDIIPSLEVLGLGGEAVSAGDASAWSQTTSVIIAYGPSECTVGCTINNNVRESTNIGKGVGGLTWIVDPDDHNRLMPVGAVGELLVEGPVVGLGYLRDPAKTAEVFIQDPTWLLTGGPSVPGGRRGRLYKTGDLVRYDPDGTGAIAFVGRKDQQVKLRGQRIELAEVEHHLRGKLPTNVKVVAEVIKPGGGDPTLVAFIEEHTTTIPTSATENEGGPVTLSPELSLILGEMDITLSAEIPRYMVPSSYIPLRKMPSLVSGKIDRKRLREIGAAMTREEVARLRVASSERDEPESEMERALHRAWVNILRDTAEIGLQDSFFALGGNSLKAMRLVSAARHEGIALTVATIFNFPTLKAMAAMATPAPREAQEPPPPFSLLEEEWSREQACADVAKLCEVEEAAIEDVYPCTPLQEALMALSAKVKEAYVAQRVVDLEDAAAAEKLRSAFEIAAADTAILRTRIVQVRQHGLVQVVINEDIPWHRGNDLQDYLIRDREAPMELGKPLVRYALITEDESKKVYFVLTMHHALYDGWSMPLVVDRVNRAYEGERIRRPAEFKDFIRYLNSTGRESAERFWREKLQGANGTQFPPLPWEGYQTQADSLLELHVPLSGRPASNTTVATVIRGAWAYVASKYSACADVVFGETLTGRNAPISGCEEIEGPMITTVPLRVQVRGDMTVAEYLQEIHDQTVKQIPYEHTGLQHIRRLSPDAYEACELRTGLVLHPSSEEDADPNERNKYPANRLVPAGDAEAAQEALKFNTYALMLVCALDANDGFSIMASFDSKTVEPTVMVRALNHLARVSQQLCQMTEEPLSDLQYLTAEEEAGLARLSTANPQSVEKEYPSTTAVWIIDPLDGKRLVPLGAVGELAIASATDMSLLALDSAPWLKLNGPREENGVPTKLYRTNRLAKLDASGTVQLIQDNKRGKSARDAAAVTAQPRPKRISATSAKQRRLRTLWSRVLGLSEEDIGLDDSFFRLGGDSISAMKLVSEARLEGLRLTVAQVFQKRTLYDMAGALAESKPAPSQSPQGEAQTTAPFELVEGAAASAIFIDNVIRPALVSPTWNIVNVLPVRPLQAVAIKGTVELPRFSTRYEAMYFDGAVDRTQLFRACQELVTRNEILRTVFIAHQHTFLGVVLENVKVPVQVYEIDGDVETFVQHLCHVDIRTRMPLGSCFVKWLFIQSSNGSSALVFRISHAQYDEICLPHMLHQLSALYEGRPVPEAVPFSSFVAHVVKTNIPESISYWRDLLRGSSLSVVKPDTPVENRDHFAIHRKLDIAARSRDITVATLPTAAWALCLARRLNLRDVTFGEVVSGRNIDLPGDNKNNNNDDDNNNKGSNSNGSSADVVAGPCWQYVPVRVKFEPEWTAADLLAHVQHQHIASSAHEGMGLPEIVASCTDWPATTDWFDSVVHQDVEHVEDLGFAGVSGRTETIYPHFEPLREWKVQAFPEGDSLTIEIITFASWEAHARELLDEMEEAMRLLVDQPGALLFSE
ncbi:surfactin synthetase subunit 3 [Sodiomyces alkalinus F11]|uniref:Surfactin synthetase subunit 3 n=1 Tax=Sodiomyces alkalinus (strain CBS 110278 / VKM F-3762 / F11) TaxID=1314773 RepID=A0A3N2Q0U5_SODAK|nr:surfactin synthetase subunit 3 [Sodiomyces alkalinus F11]ROT40235.1 surfactin synthetase subunit 3 [Sodiomyces alkalinus F11]